MQRGTQRNLTFNLHQRAWGSISPQSFYALYSNDKILRLEGIQEHKDHHNPDRDNPTVPVNAVCFNSSGNLLLSGGDRDLCLWNLEDNQRMIVRGRHLAGILDVKFLTNEKLISSGADGQVVLNTLANGEITRDLISYHLGRVHSTIVSDPHTVYSCSEAGRVKRMDVRLEESETIINCRNKDGNPRALNLNSIAPNVRREFEFVVAGGDDYTRIFDVRFLTYDTSGLAHQPLHYLRPNELEGRRQLGISGVDVSEYGEIAASYVNEKIYLFRFDNGKWSQEERIPPLYGHTNDTVVRGVSFFGGVAEGVITGSDCGRVYVWNKDYGILSRVLEAGQMPITCVASHLENSVFASASLDGTVRLWAPDAPARACFPPEVEQRAFNEKAWLDAYPEMDVKYLDLFSPDVVGSDSDDLEIRTTRVVDDLIINSM